MAKKVCFETYGCRLNRAEALAEEARYLAAGYELTNRHSEADVIVLRGCSVTARAQRDCETQIAHLRHRYPATQLVIRGCLPDADRTSPPPAAAECVPTRTARAYLKVQDGCSGLCTFCIVPSFRGKSVSVPFDEAMDRARRFVDVGYHEIVVTGCNLALYASQGRRLPELAAALASLAPDVRIRIGSVEPGDCAAELVDVMAENDSICRFLHLPVQSGSPRILSAMRRGYLIREVDELVSKATRAMPMLGLGCDLMSGFPGETDLDHLATVGFLKRHPFSNVHVFPYSKRPGTAAATLPTEVPHRLRSVRAHELSAIAATQRQRFAQKFVGRTVSLVIEDAAKRSGWTSEYLPCEISLSADVTLARKQLVTARISQVRHGKLVALPVDDRAK